MNHSNENDLRLIEAGFPCHQVGAETQRERDTGKAPPPNRLHVWWARRPLTPSRAAILASLLPADTDPDWFLRQLGIEKRVVEINGVQWTLTGKILEKIEVDEAGDEVLRVDERVLQLLRAENVNREKNRALTRQLITKDASLSNHEVIMRWQKELRPISDSSLRIGALVRVKRIKADSAWAKERISFENAQKFRTTESKYGYNRAFSNAPNAKTPTGLIVLDPTSGGGSIPFEAIRLGHTVIANELNPVGTVILHATLEYPKRYGAQLGEDIQKWGSLFRQAMVDEIAHLFPVSKLCEEEQDFLETHLKKCPELIPGFQDETLDGFLYCRQVTCPNCGGEAPLLNTCWLSKEAGKQWGVKIITDGKSKNGTVRFETYRALGGKGPAGEDPNFATVNRAIGQCIHCITGH
jgi:putative DNA methylase